MPTAFRLKLAWIIAVTAAGCLPAAAQAPGVLICNQGRLDSQYQTGLVDTAKELYAAGDGLRLPAARRQMKRASCQLALPEASTSRLAARDICIAARQSHVRIGWWYLCAKCGKWHLNLAGGYWLTADGAAATCFHVVEPKAEMREGCLVVVDNKGKLFPVAEVLAANGESDACVVRVSGEGFTPLALNTNIYPGDSAFCYSDPLAHRDYFSAGIVNRFYQPAGSASSGARAAATADPTRINVSTDWAPGSSGSAVLDECGNVIGHVSTFSTATGEANPKAQQTQPAKSVAIVYHEAVSARDVRRLIQAPKEIYAKPEPR